MEKYNFEIRRLNVYYSFIDGDQSIKKYNQIEVHELF